jgi:MoxR-like ATPase
MPSGRQLLEPFYTEMSSVLVGQRKLIDRLLMALLTDGHALLEGVPGLAKTLAIRTVAAALQLKFQRLQFTPDLLPADIIGTQIYNPRTGEFTVKPGPVFANVILADEINRAPAKVQSALLEAMQERQVTIGDRTYPLPSPFFVLATQNPLEQEGTYPLPEAQVDRFMFKVLMDYPSESEELQIVDRMSRVKSSTEVRAVLSAEELAHWRDQVDELFLAESIKSYIVTLIRATRTPVNYSLGELAPLIQCGASPRATVALVRAAKAHAFLQGREFVTPEDVKLTAADVLRHRVLLSYEAEAEDVRIDTVLQRLLDGIPLP